MTQTVDIRIDEWQNDGGFAGVERLTYRIDGGEDWALAWPGERDAWVVVLHGHGSRGDQIFTRPDVREKWLREYRALGLGVLSPNLRDNAWMCPEAVDDLHRLIGWAREHYGIASCYFLSGSMGGSGNLIYATLHPEDVTALSALGSVTDIWSYVYWLRNNPGGVKDEIYQAIVSAYGGVPEEMPDKFAAHSVLRHLDRLTMPMLVSHGDDDALIPVEQSRQLAHLLIGKPDFTYLEIAGGDHDSPLFGCDLIGWLTGLLG